MIWATDASFISIKNIEKLIYKTRAISNFMDEYSDQYFVLANKGMGKTLLLSYKRFSLYNKYSNSKEQQSNVLFIPRNRPYLDNMSDFGELSSNYKDFLASLENSKKVWELSLKLAVISHIPYKFEDFEQEKIMQFGRAIGNWVLTKKELQPTIIFKELISANSPSQLSSLMTSTQPIISSIINNIHRGIYIFIDKIDQGIRSFSKRSWITVQAGLLEAAWELAHQNKHIKTYVTIRQEAFFNYQSSNKNAIRGNTVMLEYTKNELHEMMNSLSQFYEKRGIEEVIKPSEIFIRTEEVVFNMFDYLFQHSIGRPRDIVLLINKLINTTLPTEHNDLHRLISKSCAEIIRNIFDESAAFLTYLREEQCRHHFFSFIRKNILTRCEILEVVANYNEMQTLDIEGTEKHLKNPFVELYAIGLLGILEVEQGLEERKQIFKQPSDYHNFDLNELPLSNYYFIHPALTSIISSIGDINFRKYEQIAIGHQNNWSKSDMNLLELQDCLCLLDKQPSMRPVAKEIRAFISLGGLFIQYNTSQSLQREWVKIREVLRLSFEIAEVQKIYVLMENMINEVTVQNEELSLN